MIDFIIDFTRFTYSIGGARRGFPVAKSSAALLPKTLYSYSYSPITIHASRVLSLSVILKRSIHILGTQYAHLWIQSSLL